MLQSRYRRIVIFFFRMLMGLAFWELIFPRIGLKKISQRSRSKRLREDARRFRQLAVDMGGVLIKVGQFLSTRVDVLPVEITGELAGLQDEVPPEKFEDIQSVAEEQFEMSLDSKYYTFDKTPIAAASLGQAHHATLRVRRKWMKQSSPSNEKSSESQERALESRSLDDYSLIDVIVKIQRKDIEELISTDLAALRTVGGWLNKYSPIRRRMDIPSLLEEFTQTLYEEIDYIAEGMNAETFAKNFTSDSGVLVPRVIWSHTAKRVLTLEDVRGIKINNFDEITASGIDREKVASKLLNTYLKQIFEDGFFHADPHPGNLFVTPIITESGDERLDCPEWLLTFVDFGMVGRLPPNIYDGMRELLIGVGTRDANRVVESSQKLGFLLPSADLDLLKRAEAELFDRFWGKDMTELSQVNPSEMIEFAREFRELLYEFPFQIPQDFIFIGRTIGILSGLCTGLDPAFNVWDHIVPFAQKIVVDDAYKNREKWFEEIRDYIKRFVLLPARIDSLINRLERGELPVRDAVLKIQVKRLEKSINRLKLSLIYLSVFVIGIILYLEGYLVFSILLFLIAIILIGASFFINLLE